MLVRSSRTPIRHIAVPCLRSGPQLPPAGGWRPLIYRNLRLRWPRTHRHPGDIAVRIISRSRLVAFWEGRTADRAVAERDLAAWYKLARNAAWPNFGALRQTFGSADQVGNCVVFDVGNNRYRLIGRVNYARGIVYVLRVMDHREYDAGRWVEECGCRRPPPGRPGGRPRTPEGRSGTPSRKRRS